MVTPRVAPRVAVLDSLYFSTTLYAAEMLGIMTSANIFTLAEVTVS